MKKIIFYILSLIVMILVAAIGSASFATVLCTFYGVSCKTAVFLGALFAVPFYVINFKTGDKLESAIKEYHNRYANFAMNFICQSYEVQESILDAYLKGESNIYVDIDAFIDKLKTATYKLTKKPLIFVECDGRATFTLLKAYSKCINHPVPYLML